MAEISEAQRKTRRRAIGRLLIRKASDLLIMTTNIESSRDLEFLDEKELARLRKLVEQTSVVGKHLEKLGVKLDEAS